MTRLNQSVMLTLHNETIQLTSFLTDWKSFSQQAIFESKRVETLSQKRHWVSFNQFFSYSPSKKTSPILMGTLRLWFCTYFQRNCVLWIKISPLWNLQPKKKYWVATLSSLFQKLLLRRICEDFWQMTSLVRCEMSGLLH